MSLTPEKLILYSSKLFSSSDGRVHCRYQFMLQEQTLRRQSIRFYSTGQHHCTWHWQISLLFSWRNMINLVFINFHFRNSFHRLFPSSLSGIVQTAASSEILRPFTFSLTSITPQIRFDSKLLTALFFSSLRIVGSTYMFLRSRWMFSPRFANLYFLF